MPFDRSKYPPDWDRISRETRERAGQRCERCKAPNHAVVWRCQGSYIFDDGRAYDDETGAFLGYVRGSELPVGRFVRIVLTVAHVNHDTTDNRPANLRCWCQKHHLAHDRELHTEHARATRRSRKAARELFDGGGTR